MNRVNKHNAYSIWRKKQNTVNKYCMDIDFIEYCFVNNKIVPYALIEITEINEHNELENCTWENNKRFKKNHIELLEHFSKHLNIPWFLVLTKIIKEKRYFKVYNSDLKNEKILNERQFIELLNILQQHKVKDENIY